MSKLQNGNTFILARILSSSHPRYYLPYPENNSNQCLKYHIRNGQLSFLEMIHNLNPILRYCTDMTTIHFSSPNTRCILTPYIVLIRPATIYEDILIGYSPNIN